MVFVFPIRDENRPSKRPFVTYGLIAANVSVFFMQMFNPRYDWFYTYGAIPIEILRGERLWTLLTSMFVHGDLLHLLGNMVFLWIFGDNIEDTLGHAKYLLFYVVGGFIASYAHVASTVLLTYTSRIPYFTPDFGIPTVGASGAISAVLGAYLVLFPRSRIRTLVYLAYILTFASVPAYFYLGFWFLYQILMGFGFLLGAPSSVAFWAHIGGYVYGAAAVKAVGVKPRGKPVQVLREGRIAPITGPLVLTPLVDVLVEGDRVMVLAELPGLEEKDISIEVSEWTVVISAELRDMRFYRQVTLPVPVAPRVQNLLYRNGVLSFTLYRIP